MSLKIWFYKKFKKDYVVRCYVATPDRKMFVYYRIPKDGIITINNKKFIVSHEDFLMVNGIATYIFNNERGEPINPLLETQTAYNPNKFKIAIDNNIAEDIFKSQEVKEDVPTYLFIFGGVIILALAIMGFFLYSQLSTIIDALKEGGLL